MPMDPIFNLKQSKTKTKKDQRLVVLYAYLQFVTTQVRFQLKNFTPKDKKKNSTCTLLKKEQHLQIYKKKDKQNMIKK